MPDPRLKPARRRKTSTPDQPPRILADAIYDRHQVAAILRTSPRSVSDFTRQGLPTYSVSRGQFLYLGADLLEWLRRQRITDAPQSPGVETGSMAPGDSIDARVRDRGLDSGTSRTRALRGWKTG